MNPASSRKRFGEGVLGGAAQWLGLDVAVKSKALCSYTMLRQSHLACSTLDNQCLLAPLGYSIQALLCQVRKMART